MEATQEQVNEQAEVTANAAAEKLAQQEREVKEKNIKAQMESLLREFGELKDVPLNKATPLVKGFRNERTILPVTLLQRRINDVEDNVNAAVGRVYEQVGEQMQYVFQYISKMSNSINTLSNALEAMLS